MPYKEFRKDLDEDLSSLKEKNIYRELSPVEARNGRHLHSQGKKFLDFASNDYLGLSTHSELKQATQKALRRWGAGSGASRLISGDLQIHEDLERRLAQFKKEESCLVFSSGYMANLAAVTSLLDERDMVLVDRYNHASLVDAAKLSRAKLQVYPHRDVQAARNLLKKSRRFRRRLLITDSYFSMDGDIAPLPDLLSACEETDSMLMVDEAHAIGVFGSGGRGLTEHFGLQGKVHIVMGTLSKSLGSVGGYIAGCHELRATLINRAKTFIYTTAPSPMASAAAIAAVEWIKKNPTLIRTFQKSTTVFREYLQEDGFDLMGSIGPIVPIKIGDSAKVMAWREALLSEGIWAGAVRPPTVPKNTDRIRLSLKATHTDADLQKLRRVMKKVRDQIQ